MKETNKNIFLFALGAVSTGLFLVSRWGGKRVICTTMRTRQGCCGSMPWRLTESLGPCVQPGVQPETRWRNDHTGTDLDWYANKARFHRATEDGLALWVNSTWADAVQDLSEFSRARGINFDSCNKLNNRQINAILHDNLTLAEHLYRKNGTVLLVLNFTLGRMANPKKAAQKYIDQMREWREQLNPGNRTKPAFTVYTSKTLPMLNSWLPLGF